MVVSPLPVYTAAGTMARPCRWSRAGRCCRGAPAVAPPAVVHPQLPQRLVSKPATLVVVRPVVVSTAAGSFTGLAEVAQVLFPIGDVWSSPQQYARPAVGDRARVDPAGRDPRDVRAGQSRGGVDRHGVVRGSPSDAVAYLGRAVGAPAVGLPAGGDGAGVRPPALIWATFVAVIPVVVFTAVGTFFDPVVESPSWPAPLPPQQYAAPDAVRAQVCAFPAVTCTTLLRPLTRVGVSRRVLVCRRARPSRWTPSSRPGRRS